MTQSSGLVTGPHQGIQVEHARDAFTAKLFDSLWSEYRRRVSYVQMYEQLLRSRGGNFVNDHIAFRTFATQSPNTGIHSLGRIFEALGYQAAGAYHFPDKHLSAIHFQHAHPEFPKLFVSELQTWKLNPATRSLIQTAVQQHRDPLSTDLLSALWRIDSTTDCKPLLQTLVQWFSELPWPVPQRDEVVALNRESQYGAWVLVHGYNVNHFTSLINSHGVDTLDDIEKTSAALAQAGVPMKSEIEGAVGSALRQTATEAVTIDVPVMINDQLSTMPWTYAYFELAQRDWNVDPVTNKRYRFEGFLGAQATQLFEMTRIK
jgi:hypothetical protein